MSLLLCVFCRLSGLENGLLGLNSKVNAVVWAKSIADVENMDIICFGHLLFEMCTGYELPSVTPTAGHYQLDLDRYPQVNFKMRIIFHTCILMICSNTLIFSMKICGFIHIDAD